MEATIRSVNQSKKIKNESKDYFAFLLYEQLWDIPLFIARTFNK